jgi:hypothetical protein
MGYTSNSSEYGEDSCRPMVDRPLTERERCLEVEPLYLYFWGSPTQGRHKGSHSISVFDEPDHHLPKFSA